MIKFSFKCTSCEACKNICHSNAITFEFNSSGHKYPVIDREKCVNCNLCSSVCAIYKKPSLNKAKEIFLFRQKNDELLLKSSSGGFARALSIKALEAGVKVFGVFWNEDKTFAYHDEVTFDNIDRACKSKYNKANMNDLYKQIDNYLNMNCKILVFGLPCENFGLLEYFGSRSNNICFVDLFCGGSLSPFYLKNYIEQIKKKYKNEISNIDFRSKKYGAEIYATEVTFSSGLKKYLNGNDNLYICLLGSEFVRLSCFNCQFGFLDSSSDLRIGDYFGSETRGNGLSVVLNYSTKEFVNCLINDTKSEGYLQEIFEGDVASVTKCRSKNRFIGELGQIYEMQKKLYLDLRLKNNFSKVIKKYVIKNMTIKKKIYIKLPYYIKKWVSK